MRGYQGVAKFNPRNTLLAHREDARTFKEVNRSRSTPKQRQLNLINGILADKPPRMERKTMLQRPARPVFTVPSTNFSQGPARMFVSTSTRLLSQPITHTPECNLFRAFAVEELCIYDRIMLETSISIYRTNESDQWILKTKNGDIMAQIDSPLLETINANSVSRQIAVKLIRNIPFRLRESNVQSARFHLTFGSSEVFADVSAALNTEYPKIFRSINGVPPSNHRLETLHGNVNTLRKRVSSTSEAPAERVRRIKFNDDSEDVGEIITRTNTRKINPPAKPISAPLGTPWPSGSNRISLPLKNSAKPSYQPFKDAPTVLKKAVKERAFIPTDNSTKRDLYAEKVNDSKQTQPPPPAPLKTMPGTQAPNVEKFPTAYKFIFNDHKIMDVAPDDFSRLDEGEFLNDTLVNFYLKYFHQVTANENKSLGDSIYIFNTFFYDRLSYKPPQKEDGKPKEEVAVSEPSNYDKVRKWTSKVDLFKMKYVIVPINAKLHWNLAIIYNLPALLRPSKRVQAEEVADESAPRKIDLDNDCVIFVLDSLRSRSYASLGRTLSTYICQEAADKLNASVDKRRIVTMQVDTPQQTNFCDCGVYLIHYVHQFMKSPEKLVELMSGEGDQNGSALQRMWQPSLLRNKRGVLKRRIVDFREENEENKKDGLFNSPGPQDQSSLRPDNLDDTRERQVDTTKNNENVPASINKAIQILDSSIEETDKEMAAAAVTAGASASLPLKGNTTSGNFADTSVSAHGNNNSSKKSTASNIMNETKGGNSEPAVSKRNVKNSKYQSVSPKSPAQSRRTSKEEASSPVVVENDDDDDVSDGDEVEVVKESRAKRFPKPALKP